MPFHLDCHSKLRYSVQHSESNTSTNTPPRRRRRGRFASFGGQLAKQAGRQAKERTFLRLGSIYCELLPPPPSSQLKVTTAAARTFGSPCPSPLRSLLKPIQQHSLNVVLWPTQLTLLLLLLLTLSFSRTHRRHRLSEAKEEEVEANKLTSTQLMYRARRYSRNV